MPEIRLARLAFKDNITLMRRGGQCWASRALHHFTEVGALGALAIHHPSIPLWNHLVETAQGIADSNSALWARHSQNPRTLPAHPIQVPSRTLYTFAAWFRHVSDGAHVHHNISAQHWRTVVRFCTGTHSLACRAAAWHGRAAPPNVCPCCQASPEDEVHMVLECRAYAHLRRRHPALFSSLPPNPCRSMLQLFRVDNFRQLSRFLTACFDTRAHFVAEGDNNLSTATPLSDVEGGSPAEPLPELPPTQQRPLWCLIATIPLALILMYIIFTYFHP